MTFRFVLLLLSLALLQGGCRPSGTAGVTEVADQFIRTLAAERVHEAYTSSAFDYRARTSFDAFSIQAGKLKPGALNVEWQTPIEENGNIRLTGRVRQSDGTEAQTTLILKKEVGRWKVAGLEVEG